MEYKFTIKGRLDGLNEYTSANRTNPYKGGSMKSNNEDVVIWAIRQQLKKLSIDKPVLIHYRFYEPNSKRDNDNILGCAAKFVQDSLVSTKVLKNDNQKCIHRYYFDTHIDALNPRIEVTITELTARQSSMDLVDILFELKGR